MKKLHTHNHSSIQILIIFIFLLNSIRSYSQTICIDSIQIKSNYSCSEIASTSQKLICEKYSSTIDSIIKISKIWEDNCGKNEPNQRIKILTQIEKKIPVDDISFEYFVQYKEDYILRTKISMKKNKRIFEKYKNQFYYVPIGESFDSLTNELAKSKTYILDNRSSAYLMCLLWSNNDKRFDALVKSRYFRKGEFGRKIDSLFYTGWLKGVFLTYHAGYWFPLKKMQNTFTNNYEFGVSFGRAIKHKFRIDIDLNTRLLTGSKSLMVNFNDSIQSAKTKFGFSGGLMISKQLNFNYKTGMDIRFKAMKTGISTNLYRIADNITMDRIYYTLESYSFSLGIALRHRLFYHNTLFYFIDYNYALFQNDKRLITNIGNTYLSAGLGFQF